MNWDALVPRAVPMSYSSKPTTVMMRPSRFTPGLARAKTCCILTSRCMIEPGDVQDTAAVRHFDPAYVGSGSFTSIWRCPRYVCSSPNSGGKADIPDRQLRAITGREQMQQTNVRQCGYSITSSARCWRNQG